MELNAIQLSWLLVIGTLTFSSIFIYLLRLLKPNSSTLKTVWTIIKSWWVIAACFLLALSWQTWGLLTILYILTLLIIREYLKVSRVPHKMYLQISLSLLCTLQYLALVFQNEIFFLALLPVLCLWIIPGLVIYRSQILEIELVTAVGVGLTLKIYYLSHISALSALPQLNLSEDQLTYAPLLLLFMTWSNDVFQFIAGKLFGKRKIVAQVSPNKTLAGFIGGIIGTIALGTVGGQYLLDLSLSASIALGFLIGISGMFGDLFFSAVKRKIEIKDFSQALPGHGGFIDRMDSLIFTAPIYFHFILWMKG